MLSYDLDVEYFLRNKVTERKLSVWKTNYLNTKWKKSVKKIDS